MEYEPETAEYKKYKKQLKKEQERANQEILKLPKMIIPFKNEDKENDEEWDKGRDEMNIPCPFRCIISGPVNMGKTTTIKNIILKAIPQYQKIWVAHCCDLTKEYDILKNKDDEKLLTISDVLPPKDWFEDEKDMPTKKMVILDDIDYKNIDRKGAKKGSITLDRLYGYFSSHHYTTVICTCQNFFNLLSAIRRMSNLLILGRISDGQALKSIGTKIGIEPETFKEYLKLLEKPHDTLWFDTTKGTPYPMRKNCYELFELE